MKFKISSRFLAKYIFIGQLKRIPIQLKISIAVTVETATQKFVLCPKKCSKLISQLQKESLLMRKIFSIHFCNAHSFVLLRLNEMAIDPILLALLCMAATLPSRLSVPTICFIPFLIVN